MNIHNITHPLIKFRTPVRHVSVTTLGENNNGEKLEQMGDIPRARNASTETTPVVPSANAVTQAPTVAAVKAVEMHAAESVKTETQAEDKLSESATTGDLQAWFESDSTADGTKFAPNRLVSQSWTLRNPGPEAWPAGCAVYYIGGDDIRNLDSNHASSISAMTSATRSNVLESSLEPGKTAVFKVLLKAPPREGRVISYWRVKTPDGRPFGHKLWVDITVSTTPAELPEKHVVTPPSTPAEVVEPAATEAVVKSEASSTMIFPKLDKESPISSVHEAASALTPMVKPTNKTAEEELLDDVESLELEESETEDGFLTDEEYDILDASDEDFLAEAQKAVQQ
jgi:next to BRCA1 gene 1 protein